MEHEVATSAEPLNQIGNRKGMKPGSKWMTTPEGKIRLSKMMKRRWRKIHQSGKKFLGRPTRLSVETPQSHVHAGGSLAERAVKASVVAHLNGGGQRPAKMKGKNVAHIYFYDAKSHLGHARVAFTGLGDLMDTLSTRFADCTLTEARLEFDV